MSNFKIGEKVVCVNGIHVIEINPIPTGILDGYYYYDINRFRKPDHQFAQDLCAQLIEEFQTETIYN